jgi:hypothetical protein
LINTDEVFPPTGCLTGSNLLNSGKKSVAHKVAMYEIAYTVAVTAILCAI